MRPGKFPRPHLYVACALALTLLVVGISRFTEEDQRFGADAALQHLSADAAAPVRTTAAEDGPTATEVASGKTASDPPQAPGTPGSSAGSLGAAPEAAPGTRIRETRVQPGDSLARIFKREGVSPRELALLIESEPLGRRLKSIFPGHGLAFTLTEDNTLLKLTYSPGPMETLEFERAGDTFVAREVVREPRRSKVYKHGVIDHSLFVSSQRAGLNDALTMRLAQIFQWDIDFVLDIRNGDEFHVLFEELYIDDEFVGFGNILAAEFINQKQSYRAILYTDVNGNSNYYNPEGDSMRKAFLRAPVEFTRISSNFNLRRVHPLFKRTMPHRGIDYAAPTGTPILASGDGRVTIASRTQANGNYIVLQHGEQFVTKYLHLSKFARGVKAGVRVKQGQVIGYVGATGWATAPHLHYEFLVNGVHKNPRTVTLPNAEPVPRQELERFAERAEPLLALLDSYKQQTQIALAR